LLHNGKSYIIIMGKAWGEALWMWGGPYAAATAFPLATLSSALAVPKIQFEKLATPRLKMPMLVVTLKYLHVIGLSAVSKEGRSSPWTSLRFFCFV
jgi:hypothetical protein